MPLHRVRRAASRAGAARRDEQQDELDRRDEARDERRGPPGADERIGCEERRIHSATRFRYAGAGFLRPAPRSARDRRRAAPSRASRARPRSARRRAPTGGRRRAGQLECCGSASTPGDARAGRVSSATVVATPVPTLYGPPPRPTAREQRGDDVADEDEVAALLPVAVDRRLLAARQALEEDRDDAALRARSPGAGRRRSRTAATTCVRAVDAVPAGEVLLAALLRDPVGRERQERRVLGRGLGAFAVARAAGRGEDHLRARAPPASTFDRADDVDGGVVVRAAASTSARRPARRGGRRRRRRRVNGSRMSCSSSVARRVERSRRLPEAKSSTTVTVVAAGDAARRRGSTR